VPYRANYSLVIRTYGSPGNKSDLQDDGAICTDLIGTGEWHGVSNLHEWDARDGGEFYPVCNVSWVGDPQGTTLGIWTTMEGRDIGMADCDAFDAQSNSRVRYFQPGKYVTD
jgi:hypothetical protein